MVENSPVLMEESTNTEPIEITGNFMTIPLSAAVDVVDGVGNRAVKTAISLPEIVRQTNAFSKKYRGGCMPRLLDSNPKALFLHYNVKCNKEDSDPAGHDVRVQFDVSKVQETQQAKDLDIQVQCSCPRSSTGGRSGTSTSATACSAPRAPSSRHRRSGWTCTG